jgi:hypothetical protein
MGGGIERKHGALFKCMYRKRDAVAGHLYVFHCYKTDYHANLNYPAVERWQRDTPADLAMGFRFWESDRCYFTEIPCLKALRQRSGHSLKIHHFLGELSDLEYAELVADNDFVVDKGKMFYHDMIAHVLQHIRWYRNSLRRSRPKYLRAALTFYKELATPDPLLELAFGITADSHSDFTPVEFLLNTVTIPGWVSLMHKRPLCADFVSGLRLSAEYAAVPLAFRMVAFWRKFAPIAAKTHPEALEVELLTADRVMEIIGNLAATSRTERIHSGNYYVE